MNPCTRTLTVLAVAGAGLLLLPSAISRVRPQEPAAEHQEESPLEAQMEKIDRGMKALRRGVTDPAKAADNIVLVRGMQEASLLALPLTPEPFKPMTDLEKLLWRIDFERQVLQLTDGLLLLERALVQGRFDDAKKQHEALMALKKESHNTFVPPEEEE